MPVSSRGFRKPARAPRPHAMLRRRLPTAHTTHTTHTTVASARRLLRHSPPTRDTAFTPQQSDPIKQLWCRSRSLCNLICGPCSLPLADTSAWLPVKHAKARTAHSADHADSPLAHPLHDSCKHPRTAAQERPSAPLSSRHPTRRAPWLSIRELLPTLSASLHSFPRSAQHPSQDTAQ
jgi:hypothetical protein